MSVTRLAELEREPSKNPLQGASDGPRTPYPATCQGGREEHGPVLPSGRRLPEHQPLGPALRVPQAALRLGGPRPGPPSAASQPGARALLPAGCCLFLLTPVPWRRRPRPFLVPPPPAQASALLGTPEAGRRGRICRPPRKCKETCSGRDDRTSCRVV